jgi:signal transduction histidine kinase
MAGLAVTLAAVAVFSSWTFWQIARLEDLQTRIVDRNRRDSLQLLRIQSDLDQLGLVMRDMLSGDEPYPMDAWKAQFERLKRDLDDGLRTEQRLAPAERSPDRQHYLTDSLTQFWSTLEQAFALSAAGHEREGREMIRGSAEAQQGSIVNTVARLLVQNNEVDEQVTARIQGIYTGVEHNIYLFVAAVLVMIAITSLYLIRSNRRLFQRLEALSAERRDLARKVINVQEEMLRSISRELHDEFGQILTAIGAMLTRAARHDVPASFKEDVLEIREVAQSTLERVRSLSLVLHPSILDEGGLEQAIDWYIPVFHRQSGIAVEYEKTGASPVIPDAIAIHVYRVLQEALNNVAKHAHTDHAWVRVHLGANELRLEIEDHGAGMPLHGTRSGRRGIGTVAMRERAELLRGAIEFSRPDEGGTLVKLTVPLAETGEAAALLEDLPEAAAWPASHRESAS